MSIIRLDNTTLPHVSNLTTITSRFKIPVSLFYFGSLGLTVVVVIAIAIILLCRYLCSLRRKTRPPEPARMISNNDFNLRISDVLNINNKRRKLQRPRTAYKVPYFKQDSYEASRFDRTYAVPFVSPPFDNIIPMEETQNNEHDVAIGMHELKEQSTSKMEEHIMSKPVASPQVLSEAKSELDISSSMPVVLRNKTEQVYQVPKVAVTAQLQSPAQEHYQVPASHYQTPKSTKKFTTNFTAYETPRKS